MRPFSARDSRAYLIARREYLSYVATWGFWLSLALVPVFIVVGVLVALVLYALLGGADFGGGVWDLLATGPRARDQRQVIAQALIDAPERRTLHRAREDGREDRNQDVRAGNFIAS